MRSDDVSDSIGSNAENTCDSYGDVDRDDLAWRVSSEIEDVSDVESEAEDSPVILTEASSLVTGRVERVKVISASSPGHVVGRPVIWEDQYYTMMEDLTDYCKVSSATTRIRMGMGVGVKIDKLGWTRARITTVMEHQVVLYLCDFGYNVTLPLKSESLHLLLPRHAVLPHLAQAFHVSGVVPAGGGGWTRSARIMTDELLWRGEVEVTVVGPPVIDTNLPSLPSYPAHICVMEQVTLGPMDPVTTTRTDLTHALRKAGLALPSRVLDIPFIREVMEENRSRRDVKNIEEILREEEDEIDNLDSMDGTIVIKDFKGPKKKLIAGNEGENLTDVKIVEKRGLREEQGWKNVSTVVEEIEKEGSIEEESNQPKAWRGLDLGVRDVEGDTEVLSSSWRQENERVGTLDWEMGENHSNPLWIVGGAGQYFYIVCFCFNFVFKMT